MPYAAGGGSDITTRIVQARTAELLGQPLYVDNRAGGGTLIGTRAVQTAAADGYTLGVMDPAFIINPTLLSDARYEALAFAGATQTSEVKARLEQVNQFPISNTPEEFTSFIRENEARLVKLVREANIKPGQ